MTRLKSILPLILAAFLSGGAAFAQIPVEVFTGHQKTTLDLMFFRYFKKSSGENSRFLFFNRNRASIDYRMSSSAYLPQFGFTEAFSYNHQKMRGFAPVVVAQFLGSGITSKAGFQFAYIRKELLLFSWLVAETKSVPGIDLFFLGRYTPRLTHKINLFSQLELINTAPTGSGKNYGFTQRVRLGFKKQMLQYGLAADLSQVGKTVFSHTYNVGGFLRYEF